MEKNSDSFGDEGRLGVGNLPSEENDFELGLPKTNLGLPGHFVTEVFPGGGDASNYKKVISADKPIPIWPVIHIVVFARYQKPDGEQLIKDIGYLNAASSNDFHLILAGYSHIKPVVSEQSALCEPKEIAIRSDLIWYYDDNEFVRQIKAVEDATTWQYAGGMQLLICDVYTLDGTPANIRQMFANGAAALENVILIDIDEIKEAKLFPDFDRFFNALRLIIRNILSDHDTNSSLTWQLSDRLGLKKGGGVTLRSLAKVFKLDIYDAINEATSLKSFSVRDIRKK